jgi:hypothetical protein
MFWTKTIYDVGFTEIGEARIGRSPTVVPIIAPLAALEPGFFAL